MRPEPCARGALVTVVSLVCLSLGAGCGNHALNSVRPDSGGAAGAGPIASSAGTAGNASDAASGTAGDSGGTGLGPADAQSFPADASVRLGDATAGAGGGAGVGGGAGAGGMGGGGGIGGSAGTGGMSGKGGGGAGMGGKGGTGGGSGAGGSIPCGGAADGPCPEGQFCDLASMCGQVANATGVCLSYGLGTACPSRAAPVCGCEGMTYTNDCLRAAAGMLKASDGSCSGRSRSYPTALLIWQAPAGASGAGPLVAVTDGKLDTWDSVPGQTPENLPTTAPHSYPLGRDQTDSLFVRLAGVDVTALPKSTAASAGDCSPRLYFRLCKGCAAITLEYRVSQQLAPDLEPAWGWFDGIVGATAAINPRNYCSSGVK